jgi:hypothetical protein
VARPRSRGDRCVPLSRLFGGMLGWLPFGLTFVSPHRALPLQCIIKLKHDGYFYAINQGKRTMFVNGEPVAPGTRQRLVNNSVLEIADVSLLFNVNDDLFSQIHAELSRL